MKKTWTSQLEISFIELVKQYEDLWNVNSENYLKTKYKQRKFMEIAEVLEQLYPSHSELFTHDRLLKKFNIMKNYYRKACKLKQLTDDEHEICWAHFDRMKFIDSKKSSEGRSSERIKSSERKRIRERRSSEESNKCFEDEEEIRDVKTIIFSPKDVVDFRNQARDSSQHFPKKQKTDSSTPRTQANINSLGEQESLANFLGAKLFSVKDMAERHSLTLDILNTIHAYELRQTEREDQ